MYWDFVINNSNKIMYYFFLFFAWLEGYSFFVTVWNGDPRGFLWYWSAIVFVYSTEFIYQWKLRKE